MKHRDLICEGPLSFTPHGWRWCQVASAMTCNQKTLSTWAFATGGHCLGWPLAGASFYTHGPYTSYFCMISAETCLGPCVPVYIPSLLGLLSSLRWIRISLILGDPQAAGIIDMEVTVSWYDHKLHFGVKTYALILHENFASQAQALRHFQMLLVTLHVHGCLGCRS